MLQKPNPKSASGRTITVYIGPRLLKIKSNTRINTRKIYRFPKHFVCQYSLSRRRKIPITIVRSFVYGVRLGRSFWPSLTTLIVPFRWIYTRVRRQRTKCCAVKNTFVSVVRARSELDCLKTPPLTQHRILTVQLIQIPPPEYVPYMSKLDFSSATIGSYWHSVACP